jgi:hypothetical protein
MRLQQRLADRFRSSAAWADGGAEKSRRDHRGRPGVSAAVTRIAWGTPYVAGDRGVARVVDYSTMIARQTASSSFLIAPSPAPV